jgi:hypothetical protein
MCDPTDAGTLPVAFGQVRAAATAERVQQSRALVLRTDAEVVGGAGEQGLDQRR